MAERKHPIAGDIFYLDCDFTETPSKGWMYFNNEWSEVWVYLIDDTLHISNKDIYIEGTKDAWMLQIEGVKEII